MSSEGHKMDLRWFVETVSLQIIFQRSQLWGHMSSDLIRLS